MRVSIFGKTLADIQRQQQQEAELRRSSTAVQLSCKQQQKQQQQLHIPRGITCPKLDQPLTSSCPFLNVPYAEALQFVRSNSLPQQFSWLPQENNCSSADISSRRIAANELAKRELDNYFFLYFRVRVENYAAVVNGVKQASQSESIFSDHILGKWTIKYKFKIRKCAPLKFALLAFCSRVGVAEDPDVMFCTDGFYGDMLTGRIGCQNKVANTNVQPSNTCRAMGLANGSSIFVSRPNEMEKKSAIEQLNSDLHITPNLDEYGDAIKPVDKTAEDSIDSLEVDNLLQ